MEVQARDLLRRAVEVAVGAHEGQADKNGVPYICHPIMVALYANASPIVRAVALLHDVLEDSSVTMEDLVKLSFPTEVIEALRVLTRPKEDHRYTDYIRSIIESKNAVAIQVKIADLTDNLSKTRTEESPVNPAQRRLYEKARVDLIEAMLNL